MSEHFYLLAAHEREFRIALAEAEALLGDSARATEHVLISPNAVDAGRSAHLSHGAELLWRGCGVEGLLDLLDREPIEAHRFLIEAHKYPRRGGPDRQKLCSEIGLRVVGHPDLEDPQTRLLLVLDGGEFFFGRVRSRNTTDWHPRIHKPFSFSASLGPRLARAAVNVVAKPGDTIVDPCCGSGTIVIEAETVGVRAMGFDCGPEMPARARANARALGVDAVFGVADVRSLKGSFDAVVTNLPYDMMTTVPKGFYRDALRGIRDLAPRAAFYASDDLSETARTVGLTVERVVPQVTHTVTRRLHIVRT